MIDSFYRHPYQKHFIKPLLPMLANAGVTPNMLTIIALIAGIATIPFAAIGKMPVALVLLFLSGYLDSLDGTLARYTHSSSDFGAVLDIVSDRIVEFSLLTALYVVDPSGRALLCFLMLGSILICVTTFLVAAVLLKNNSEKSFNYHPGIMERSEAFLFFGAMFLLPGLFFYLAIGFTLLVAITAIYRLYELFVGLAPLH